MTLFRLYMKTLQLIYNLYTYCSYITKYLCYIYNLKPVTRFYAKPIISLHFEEPIIGNRYYKHICIPGYRLSVTDNVSANIKRYDNIIYFNQLPVFINIEDRLPLPM